MTQTAQPVAARDTDLLSDLIARARRKGASAADAVLFRSTSVSASLRLGKTELIERSESADIGLRVLIGQQQAVISTSDIRPQNFDTLVERALDMAKATPDDAFAGIAAPEQVSRNIPDLQLADLNEPSAEKLVQLAGEVEAAALAVAGVTNSDGGSASWGQSDIALVASNGFSGSYGTSSCGLSISVVAGSGTAMETDYDYDSARRVSDLRQAADIGKVAGERAVRRLNPRKVKTAQVPIVFEDREARSLLGAFLSGINGASIARKASFLQERMGQQVFADTVNIIEDPLIVGGPRSRPFDAEGLAPQRRALIENGLLTGWVLDLRSARQLGLTPTGNATRGVSSPPGPGTSNVWLEAGAQSPEDMIAEIKDGFYLTSFLGHGLNLVTGDFSRGAAGFWIENGRLAYPVSEVTIAGNLADMFKQLRPASDLKRRFGMDTPTVRVDGMTVAGI